MGTLVLFFIERSAPKGFACMIVRGIRFLKSFAINEFHRCDNVVSRVASSLEALSAKGRVGLKFALARHIGIATTRDTRRYDIHEDVCRFVESQAGWEALVTPCV